MTHTSARERTESLFATIARALTVSLVATTLVVALPSPAAAQVCGDGGVDIGEDCDDGNTAPGDCCSATCQFEVAGSACPDDANVCTTDQCDGAGVCTHPAGNGGTECRATPRPRIDSDSTRSSSQNRGGTSSQSDRGRPGMRR